MWTSAQTDKLAAIRGKGMILTSEKEAGSQFLKCTETQNLLCSTVEPAMLLTLRRQQGKVKQRNSMPTKKKSALSPWEGGQPFPGRR